MPYLDIARGQIVIYFQNLFDEKLTMFDTGYLILELGYNDKFYVFFLTFQGEPSFHLFGFLMCIGATAARALKSVLQGILLSSEG